MESGVRVGDSQCGMRVYPLELVASVRCGAGRFGFETEIITRAGWASRPIIETPVRCRYFPKDKAVSHFRPWVDSFRAVGMHARLLLRALLPFPRRQAWSHQSQPASKAAEPRWRRIARWISPLGAWRELRADETGRTTAAAGLAVGAFIANLPA